MPPTPPDDHDPFSMKSVADATRKSDITLPLPNREIRRKFKKLQHKPHFKRELLRRGHTLDEVQQQETPVVDEETKAKLLDNLDVQKFLDVLNGVLTGQKKVVIETTYHDFSGGLMSQTHNEFPHFSMHHTFRVEDVNNG